jgi:hypothetical protein
MVFICISADVGFVRVNEALAEKLSFFGIWVRGVVISRTQATIRVSRKQQVFIVKIAGENNGEKLTPCTLDSNGIKKELFIYGVGPGTYHNVEIYQLV